MHTFEKYLAMASVLVACTVFVPHVDASASSRARSLDLAWKTAMEAGDLEAVVACYGENATLWLPGAPVAHGRAAIREVYRGLLAANAVSEVVYSNTTYLAARDLEGGAGEFSLVLTPRKGGAPERLAGRFTTLVHPEGGRWVYDVDHASANPPN